MQKGFEDQQNQLHATISEMQVLVGEQAKNVAMIAEAVSQLTSEPTE